MKPRFHVLGWLFLFSLVASSCSSAPKPAEHTNRRQANPPSESADSLDQLDESMDAESATGPNTADNVQLFTPKPKTRYQVMQEGFDRATIMPTVSDFDPLDEPSPRLACYSVKAGDPNTVSEMVLKQMMVQIQGTADYGPLFPGSLDHVETRLVIGKNNGWVNSQNLTNEMRQVFELAKAPGSLVIRINENKFGIYQDIGAPAEVWIRKDLRNHMFFKVYRLSADRVRTEVFIGYCYLRGTSPEVVR
jgi:hypothetical protein